MKICVRLLQRHNPFFTIIIVLAVFYSILYPILIGISLFIYIKYFKHVYHKILWMSLLLFFIGLLYGFHINQEHLLNQEKVTIISKFKYEYSYRYIVKTTKARYTLFLNEDISIGSEILLNSNIESYPRQTIPKNIHVYEYYLGKNIKGILRNVDIISIDEKWSYSNYIYEFKEIYHDTSIGPFIYSFLFDDSDEIDAITDSWFGYLFSLSGIHIYFLSQLLIVLFSIQKIHMKKLLKILIIVPFFILQPLQVTWIRLLFIEIIGMILYKFKVFIPKYILLGILWISILIIFPYKIYDIGFFISFFIVLNLYVVPTSNTSFIMKQYYVILLISTILFLFHGRLYVLPMVLLPLIITLFIYMIFMPTLIMFLLNITSQPVIHLFYKLIDVLNMLNRKEFIIYTYQSSPIILSIGLIMILFGSLKYSKRGMLKLMTMMLLSLTLLSRILIGSQTPSLIILDVGQGDASVYMDKDCVVVIDAFGKVQRYLNSHGRNQIDYLYVTHSDIDHMKEVENLVDNMDIKYIITSPYQPLPNIVSSTIYDFPHQIVCGESTITILGPRTSMFDDNDDSLIILLEFLETSILFTGDASIKREQEILQYFQETIDVLKIGHHGSKTSTSMAFISSLQPQYGIISTSKNNRYGMPHKEVIDILTMNRIKYYITSLDGSIKMTIHNGNIQFETFPP
ncbi:MAG: ComEC/Rec2 family competence protein [Acholeplasmataceae bacterium]